MSGSAAGVVGTGAGRSEATARLSTALGGSSLLAGMGRGFAKTTEVMAMARAVKVTNRMALLEYLCSTIGMCNLMFVLDAHEEDESTPFYT